MGLGDTSEFKYRSGQGKAVKAKISADGATPLESAAAKKKVKVDYSLLFVLCYALCSLL
jgi:hypothetical protein